MITPDRLRVLRVVIDPDPLDPGNVIVAQAGLGAGGILQRAGSLPAPVSGPATIAPAHRTHR